MENNTKQNKTKLLNYINVFRGLAILLIVMGHTMQFGTKGSLQHLIVCETFCGGTALFMFISGFLFQHLSPKFEYKNYLSKKWTNVILPYFYTAIPGIILAISFPFAYKNSFVGLNPLVQIPVHLSIGRVHNVPSWFIPMIIFFFIFSWLFLKLEKKNILYKLLPILFFITLVAQRGVAEYENTFYLSHIDKYIIYIRYNLMGIIHFMSLYVFGMYCSANKQIIDTFYKKRILLFFLMIATSFIDIVLTVKYNYTNYTISKIFLTMLVLGLLKHYDDFIISHTKLNSFLDVIAKYSFGIFFVHWYWFFIYNQFFKILGVLPIVDNNILITFLIVFVRFIAVTTISILSLMLIKKLLLYFNKDINTRKYIGV